MIDKSSYDPDWIRAIAEKLGKRGDPKILEKVIYAFSLLEQLTRVKLPLIFKGGTSLLLLTDPPRRFSIDIDIISQVKEKELETFLDEVVKLGIFSGWVADNDRKHSPDAAVSHYKFYYTSRIGSKSGDEPILLDVLHIENPYPELISKNITHAWLRTDGEIVSVSIPSIESITADKLTAFAPTTTGILYSKNRPVEIIKQLFDVAFLFDSSKDLAIIRTGYIRAAEEELKYRELDKTWKETLQDSYDACMTIAMRDGSNNEFKQLQQGISNIINFILQRFHIDEAIVCAGKTAYLSQLLLRNENEIKRYESAQALAPLTIENLTYNKLTRLKRTNPEAFFYWYHALQLAGSTYS